MTDIRKATTEDIKLINELAWIAFPATYKDILTKEQIDYMMDWMYSPENLLKQMTQQACRICVNTEGRRRPVSSAENLCLA